jgi:hypothetical protein
VPGAELFQTLHTDPAIQRVLDLWQDRTSPTTYPQHPLQPIPFVAMRSDALAVLTR